MKGAPGAPGELQAQWWDAARRASQAAAAEGHQRKLALRPSRSAASSPLPEEVMLAVSARPSIAAGARASTLASAASADAAAPAAPPWTPQLRGSVFDGRGRAPQHQHQQPHTRRSMAEPGAPPPSAQAAYVQDREVASTAQARASQKAQLVAALQARASTVSRILGSPPPPPPPQWQPEPERGLWSPAAALGQQPVEQQLPPAFEPVGAAEPGSAAWSGAAEAGGAPPRAKGVFVWEVEPPLEVTLQGLGADGATPLPQAAARVSRTPSPAAGRPAGGRTSLAAAAAMAVAAGGPSPRGGHGYGAGSRQQSPLGSARSAAEARRVSTAAFLQGQQGLVGQITTGMPAVHDAAAPAAEATVGLWGDEEAVAAADEGGGGGGTRHSAVGDAVRARLSGAAATAAWAARSSSLPAPRVSLHEEVADVRALLLDEARARSATTAVIEAAAAAAAAAAGVRLPPAGGDARAPDDESSGGGRSGGASPRDRLAELAAIGHRQHGSSRERSRSGCTPLTTSGSSNSSSSSCTRLRSELQQLRWVDQGPSMALARRVSGKAAAGGSIDRGGSGGGCAVSSASDSDEDRPRASTVARPRPSAAFAPRGSVREGGGAPRQTYSRVFWRFSSSAGGDRGGVRQGGAANPPPARSLPAGRAGGAALPRSSVAMGSDRKSESSEDDGPAPGSSPERAGRGWARGMLRRLSASQEGGGPRRSSVSSAGVPFHFGSAGTYSGSGGGSGAGGSGGGTRYGAGSLGGASSASSSSSGSGSLLDAAAGCGGW
ncbi:hypothetical protein Rsub_00162 [Raphidocelis subcapitata]|uniref:Uncharacterized protein n=1 Tax=Raphidocelis subcapitata TaxID=307507 RepID=A0A2V0NJP1_9CHLO|nr:hypothetical protein Rsub_00162 [Raphidocelis subcapitata]|eukprot:GBF87451.1 hypothetical protein Rsub_00162 [Raphidocelis subcapitata]